VKGGGCIFQSGAIGLAEDGDGDRIVEDQRRRVVELVRRSADGDTESGSRRLGGFQDSLLCNARMVIQSIPEGMERHRKNQAAMAEAGEGVPQGRQGEIKNGRQASLRMTVPFLDEKNFT
jgi:hypothetical protein